MKIYYNPKCSKCREALCMLEENGIKPEIIRYLETTPTEEELKEIINLLGIQPEELVRKGEEIYKTAYKGKELTGDEWIEAMIKHPELIERPIVIDGQKAVIGRPPVKIMEIINHA